MYKVTTRFLLAISLFILTQYSTAASIPAIQNDKDINIIYSEIVNLLPNNTGADCYITTCLKLDGTAGCFDPPVLIHLQSGDEIT